MPDSQKISRMIASAEITMTMKKVFACMEKSGDDIITCLHRVLLGTRIETIPRQPPPVIGYDPSTVSIVKELRKTLIDARDFHKAELDSIEKDLKLLDKIP